MRCLTPIKLFGDTVNVGSRLETSSERNRIQMSKECAELVRQSGKANWVKPRGQIECKGKGELETFWLLPKSAARSSVTNSTTSHISSTDDGKTAGKIETNGESAPDSSQRQSEAKLDRLIFWVSESLLQALRQIVARRNASSKPARQGPARESVRELELEMNLQKMSLEEVKEVITLPKFDAEAYSRQVDPKTINLGSSIETQLREYVSVIASLYHANPCKCLFRNMRRMPLCPHMSYVQHTAMRPPSPAVHSFHHASHGKFRWN